MLRLSIGKASLGLGVRLGKPGDKAWGLFGSPRRRQATSGVPAMVRGLCFWLFSSRSRGPICDYCGLLRGPWCDYLSVSLLD